jgi:predicted RNA-binding Zn ribbon-like protein
MKRKPIASSAIVKINKILHQRYGYHELIRTGRGFEKHFRAELQEPRQLLVPIAESAADLLSYADPSHIRKCENSKCVLIFYDKTKNHRRRWCSMSSCGNRAKAAAFYKRKQKKERKI